MLGDDLPSVPLADALEAWDAAVEDAAAQDGAKLPDCGSKTLTHEAFSFTWECDEDADAAPDREYLIDGLFGVGELSVIFGLPKAGKSHFALHIARCEATGKPAFGRSTPEGGIHVAYIAAEGTSGFTKRVKAHVEKAGRAPKFHFLRTPLNLATMDGDVESLTRDMKLMQIRHLYIDTGRRCAPGMKENDPGEMSLFVAVADRIRRETGAHVTIITHTAKSGANHTPIGSNALPGASDINIEVVKTSDGNRATVVEARDDSDGWSMDFSLGVVSLGTDKKGREISTCLVREETTRSGQNTKEPGRPDEGKLGTSVRLLRRHLCDLSADSDLQPSRPIEGMITPVRAVPRSKLVTYLIKRGWFEEHHITTPDRVATRVATQLATSPLTKTGQSFLSKALNKLIEKGICATTREAVWLVHDPSCL